MQKNCLDLDIDNEWEDFLENGYDANLKITRNNEVKSDKLINSNPKIEETRDEIKSTPLYISTRTQISFLSEKIDIYKMFQEMDVIDYNIPKEGPIKKEIKYNLISLDEIEKLALYLKDKRYVNEQIISQSKTNDLKTNFKETRKISIGLCTKDIMCQRHKKKGAFYNCFVLIIRTRVENSFKEIHVKVFNTGKIEIPGIKCDEQLKRVKGILLDNLNKNIKCEKIYLLEDKSEIVLINSNFNCGFYIDREKLYDILKLKYSINCSFDPCSYPGIQAEYFFYKDRDVQTGTFDKSNGECIKLSFMIFRTGSVLIVGRGDEQVLIKIYKHIKDILINERSNIIINTGRVQEDSVSVIKEKTKKKKLYIEYD